MRRQAGNSLVAVMFGTCLLAGCNMGTDVQGTRESELSRGQDAMFLTPAASDEKAAALADPYTPECANALRFPATLASAANYPDDYLQHEIDYCKELVIVDPEILARLKHVSFQDVMGIISNVSDATGRKRFFTAWAENWRDTQSLNHDVAMPRLDVYNRLLSAWPNDIVLIAVVNRLELKRPNPEGRLVFQVHNNGVPTEMGIIVEYSLPALNRPGESLLQSWAEDWHALGSPKLNKDAYIERLQELVDRFHLASSLERIRTSEHLGTSDSWEMREFKKVGNALQPALLARTPKNEIRTDPEKRNRLYRLLRTDHSAALRSGNYDFMDTPVWIPNVGMHASFPSAGGFAWEGSRSNLPVNRPIFLMSINTCNGCHKDLAAKTPMHLQRATAGKPAVLSAFLSGPIPLEHVLPDCETRSDGCSLNARSWNEKTYRIGFMKRQLGNSLTENLQPMPPESFLNYRYH